MYLPRPCKNVFASRNLDPPVGVDGIVGVQLDARDWMEIQPGQ